jgi:predicted nucleotidyltransferase
MTTIFARGLPISRDEIQAFVNDLVTQFRPRKVILFGSYAYGDPNPDSDVDLLVIMRHRVRVRCCDTMVKENVFAALADLLSASKIPDSDHMGTYKWYQAQTAE